MKINLIILLVVSVLLAQCKYDKLLEIKENLKIHNINKQDAEDLNNTNNLIEIKYYDINNMDINYLKNRYNLHFKKCIADGICIFKYKGKKNIRQIINEIRLTEKKISNVKIYRKYNFQPF